MEFLKVIEKLEVYYIDHSKPLTQVLPGRRMSYLMFSPAVFKPIPKYTLHIVDHLEKHIIQNNSQAVFVVPHGQERNFLYSTKEGNYDLANMVNVSRLMIAILSPGVPFVSFDSIKDELESVV